MRRSLWMLGLLALAACGGPPGPPAAAPARGAQAFRFEADPRVGVYVSRPWGFTTSSYWIEGPDGLIVVDTQFLPSAAADLLDRAEAHLRLRGCVDMLGQLQRQVITLRMLEEASSAAVARELDLGAGHVAVLLHRAKKAIERCLLE